MARFILVVALALFTGFSTVVAKEPTGSKSYFSIVGKVAQEAGVKTLVLSHFMRRGNSENYSLHDLEGNLAHLKANYSGPVVLASDLLRIEVK